MQPATASPSMRLRTALSLLLGLALAAASATAQPTLNFKRIVNNWPTIEVYFSVACNGQPAFPTDTSKISLRENGLDIRGFTLWNPPPTGHPPFSAALVFDASGAMIGVGEAAIRAAATRVTGLMDGTLDQAALLSFNKDPRLHQQMTTDTALLRAALDSIVATGGTALYDGIYEGLLETIARGTNQTRAVIVLSGRIDLASLRTPAEVISLAQRNRIRVFTVGLGSQNDTSILEAIAAQTGGRFYMTPSAGEVAQIYEEIVTILRQSFQESMIAYQASCADGSLRTVEFSLDGFCGGDDTRARTYRAIRDTSDRMPVRIAPAVVTSSDTLVTLPIEVAGVPGTQVLHPFTCTVRYDTSRARLLSAGTAGTLLSGVPATVTMLPDGAEITTTANGVVQGGGPLVALVFAVPRHTTADTARTPVWLEQWSFEAGCLAPQIAGGELRSVADWRAACALSVPEILADHVAQTYVPMPVPVTAEVQNIGAVGMDDVVVRLTVSGDARILAADSLVSTIVIAPPRLEPGSRLSPQWLVRVLPRHFTRRIPIEVSVLHRGVEVTRCGNDLVIPPVRPPLAPRVTAEGPLQVCAGDSVTLDAGGPYASYRWNSGDTTRRITVHASGAFVVTVTDDLARVATSDTAWVVVAARPAPRLAVAGSLRFCQGDSVLLDAGAGWASYLWSTGATTRTLRTGAEGRYWVRVTSAEGCAGVSDTVQTTLLLRPPVPVITRTGDVLSTEAGHPVYRWYRNGVLIAGATGPSLAVTENGVYTVELVNGFGCTSTSAPFDMVTAIAGVDAAVDAWRIEAWPDPVQGDLTVRVRAFAHARVDLRVVDVLGRTVHAVRALAGGSSVVLPLAGLPPGAYHIIATGAGTTLHHRIMKQ